MTTDIRILKRQTLIDIAQRHQRAGTGSSRAFLAQRTVDMQWIDLSSILTPIRWAVVGAAATRLYMPERLTRDLDVAILADDSKTAREKLARAGFVHQGELSIGGATWRAPGGQSIDVIEAHEVWWKDALSEAQSNRDAQGLPVLPLRYLVLMKFQSGRVQDVADVTRMLGQADDIALDATRALFVRYAPTDSPDLESLIALGKLEFGK
jgi:hypothetical protein